ncbi:MAG: methyltransferase [Alphaproteobacteria bacterium]|nr:methyltransferase [Alphaproteobacteria bacterium]
MIAPAPLADPDAFIRAETAAARAPLVPEIVLHLATEITPIWQATEAALNAAGLAPPYWAFAWPGGQALARLLLDRPALVAGKRVLDFAAGCGIAAIAAAMAGAAHVAAAEIDPLAIAACRVNALANGVMLEGITGDIVGREDAPWDVILCGDVCYEKPMSAHILPWLRRLAATGRHVLLADPGRAYLPRSGLVAVARFTVPTSLELEDRAAREVTVYRL